MDNPPDGNQRDPHLDPSLIKQLIRMGLEEEDRNAEQGQDTPAPGLVTLPGQD